MGADHTNTKDAINCLPFVGFLSFLEGLIITQEIPVSGDMYCSKKKYTRISESGGIYSRLG